MRSITEPDLFDNNVPFGSTTPIYLNNLLWKIGLGLECTILAIFMENNEKGTLSSENFAEGNILLKDRTQTINNNIRLHIPTVNKLSNCIAVYVCYILVHVTMSRPD